MSRAQYLPELSQSAHLSKPSGALVGDGGGGEGLDGILVRTCFWVMHTGHLCLISPHLSDLVSSESTAFVASLVLKVLLDPPGNISIY